MAGSSAADREVNADGRPPPVTSRHLVLGRASLGAPQRLLPCASRTGLVGTLDSDPSRRPHGRAPRSLHDHLGPLLRTRPDDTAGYCQTPPRTRLRTDALKANLGHQPTAVPGREAHPPAQAVAPELGG